MNRTALIEAMARALCAYQQPAGAWDRNTTDGYRNIFRNEAAAALSALEAMAAIVPREAPDGMFFDPDDVCTSMGQSPWAAFCRIYAAMIAASPYAKETTDE
jgi:hypothetical protein